MASDFRKLNGQKRSLTDRFGEKYTISETGCWLWIGATDRNGYGQIRIDGKLKAAHRVSYELHNGIAKDGLDVCHSCDVPSCVNPAHLWLGTRKANLRDMREKGRSRDPFGERHHAAKLNKSDVLKIYEAKGEANAQHLASMFAVSTATINDIFARRTWRHVTEICVQRESERQRYLVQKTVGKHHD